MAINLSIAITTYNRWDLCYRALRSIVGQNIDDVEVILVDDCSTKVMPSNVRDYIYKHGEITYIRNDTNRGLAYSRNVAISIAKGRYFSFCDDDDYWPNGLIDGLFADALSTPIMPDVVLIMPYKKKLQCPELFEERLTLKEFMKQGFCPPVSSQIYRTELLHEVEGYSEKIKSGVDHDLWIKLAVINPKVDIHWGDGAVVGNDISIKRLTTNEEHRVKNIQHSLDIWKPLIVKTFGSDFYNYFYESYMDYLKYKFFKLDIVSNRFYSALKRLKSIRMVRILLTSITNSVFKKGRCTLFPSYYSSTKDIYFQQWKK